MCEWGPQVCGSPLKIFKGREALKWVKRTLRRGLWRLFFFFVLLFICNTLHRLTYYTTTVMYHSVSQCLKVHRINSVGP